ncbi:B-cell receptor-associated protein 31-like [Cucurbita moschata]|uniref:Endoplasmic reticulum transmembrane protein n=1 Tax=Cucurbita moschata TaxID=3662 RepID=A0A6J1G851_CUCMO|nr:B-cell receptor-associated protein 31-like [Cucurbita moschata]
MIHLLFTLIAAEMALILTLLFRTPLRKLVILSLDRVKRGKAPIVVQTVAGTVFVLLLSSVYSMVKIQNRMTETGEVNPTDQVLMSNHLLEASLIGFLLFLALMIDRLHHYIRELRLLRKTMEVAKKRIRATEDASAEKLKALGEESTTLRNTISKLESEVEAKTKEANDAETETDALRKQSEEYLLEYDRLLEDNQNLRNQLESTDHGSSRSC